MTSGTSRASSPSLPLEKGGKWQYVPTQEKRNALFKRQDVAAVMRAYFEQPLDTKLNDCTGEVEFVKDVLTKKLFVKGIEFSQNGKPTIDPRVQLLVAQHLMLAKDFYSEDDVKRLQTTLLKEFPFAEHLETFNAVLNKGYRSELAQKIARHVSSMFHEHGVLLIVSDENKEHTLLYGPQRDKIKVEYKYHVTAVENNYTKQRLVLDAKITVIYSSYLSGKGINVLQIECSPLAERLFQKITKANQREEKDTSFAFALAEFEQLIHVDLFSALQESLDAGYNILIKCIFAYLDLDKRFPGYFDEGNINKMFAPVALNGQVLRCKSQMDLSTDNTHSLALPKQCVSDRKRSLYPPNVEADEYNGAEQLFEVVGRIHAKYELMRLEEFTRLDAEPECIALIVQMSHVIGPFLPLLKGMVNKSFPTDHPSLVPYSKALNRLLLTRYPKFIDYTLKYKFKKITAENLEEFISHLQFLQEIISQGELHVSHLLFHIGAFLQMIPIWRESEDICHKEIFEHLAFCYANCPLSSAVQLVEKHWILCILHPTQEMRRQEMIELLFPLFFRYYVVICLYDDKEEAKLRELKDLIELIKTPDKDPHDALALGEWVSASEVEAFDLFLKLTQDGFTAFMQELSTDESLARLRFSNKIATIIPRFFAPSDSLNQRKIAAETLVTALTEDLVQDQIFTNDYANLLVLGGYVSLPAHQTKWKELIDSASTRHPVLFQQAFETTRNSFSSEFTYPNSVNLKKLAALRSPTMIPDDMYAAFEEKLTDGIREEIQDVLDRIPLESLESELLSIFPPIHEDDEGRALELFVMYTVASCIKFFDNTSPAAFLLHFDDYCSNNPIYLTYFDTLCEGISHAIEIILSDRSEETIPSVLNKLRALTKLHCHLKLKKNFPNEFDNRFKEYKIELQKRLLTLVQESFEKPQQDVQKEQASSSSFTLSSLDYRQLFELYSTVKTYLQETAKEEKNSNHPHCQLLNYLQKSLSIV